ncbi:beta-glucuronosyltransferase GlcAT14A-like [Actinidia eriantha]|uniref:beta-glucuronosyltransferase GlcAT14A-like n=1 Tax=Actinidia eriantha TaxID=165200 RepID=UPI00258F3B8D|nr:beta-glucuronosyltransferase GlcAT14A-like [Actinidia eriantha]
MANRARNLLFSLLPLSLLSLLLLFLPPPPTPNFSLSSILPPHPSPPPPKIAYFISGAAADGPRIFRLLQASYHPRNYYLLHLDRRASDEEREGIARLVGSVGVFVAADNVHVIERANLVRDEGSTPLALVLHGAAILLRAWRDWDWFVNLDASDYPLISQDDFLHILSYAPRDFNFIEHTSNTSRNEYQRIMEIVVDPGLYLISKGKMFTGNKKRTLPNAYRFFTGSPNVILSRKLVEFSILGWDNLPRKLLMFFSNTKYSHRDYFQTLACNAEEFSKTVVNSNLHFTDRNDPHTEEPRDLLRSDLEKMLSSGAAFAGKFRANDPVLDKIDSLVLNRNPGMVLPGGWCLGRRGWGRDPCQLWGDVSVLRPGPTANSFAKLLQQLMANTTFQSNQCVHR